MTTESDNTPEGQLRKLKKSLQYQVERHWITQADADFAYEKAETAVRNGEYITTE